MNYYGSYIPNHIRLTQPAGERRHAGPADKAVLEEMRQRAENAEKPPKKRGRPLSRCTIITVIASHGSTETRHCLTHGRTFVGDGAQETCPTARENKQEVAQ
jgi:hypothetical protein